MKYSEKRNIQNHINFRITNASGANRELSCNICSRITVRNKNEYTGRSNSFLY